MLFLIGDNSFLTNLSRLFWLIITSLSGFCWDCVYKDESRRCILSMRNCTSSVIILPTT